MIFSNGLDDKVRDGTKTQTRRLVKETDEILDWTAKPWMTTTIFRNNRILWETWQSEKTYAIQSGRGKKGNGRFRITKIRKETLQSITEADAKAEGVPKIVRTTSAWFRNEATVSFQQLWNSIHKKPGDRWDSNPEVWVLEIEPV